MKKAQHLCEQLEELSIVVERQVEDSIVLNKYLLISSSLLFKSSTSTS